MSRKIDPQNKILKVLSRKKAVPVDELHGSTLSKEKYALTRSIKNMLKSGLAELLPTDQSEYLRITSLGRQKLHRDELGNTTMPISKNWDGKWRIVMLDLPEDRKDEREALRYLLKKAGFVCLKNSVWISPLPYEYLFANIKKDFNLTTELMVVVSDKIDQATEKAFFELMKM
jgi:DNA-binding transcriptional regulator PaaX